MIVQFLRRSLFREQRPLSLADGWTTYVRDREGVGRLCGRGPLVLGSTIGNTILLTQERRPPGAANWEGAKEALVAVAVPGELTDRLEQAAQWGAVEVAAIGHDLALVAATIWYPA